MITVKIVHKKVLSPADEGELAVSLDSMGDVDLNFVREHSIIEFSTANGDECKVSYLLGIIMRFMADFGVKEIEIYYKEAEI